MRIVARTADQRKIRFPPPKAHFDWLQMPHEEIGRLILTYTHGNFAYKHVQSACVGPESLDKSVKQQWEHVPMAVMPNTCAISTHLAERELQPTTTVTSGQIRTLPNMATSISIRLGSSRKRNTRMCSYYDSGHNPRPFQ